ncbi:MAG: PEGA domain-containing protein [Ignavibacteria bacterium]|nr:PEGA domain-containing protein [Ignavibacteria bacterium]
MLSRNIILLLITLFSIAAYSQHDPENLTDSVRTSADTLTSEDSVKSFGISIYSNTENAEVYIDTFLIGRTPLINYIIKEGEYKFKIMNPASEVLWQNDNITADVRITRDTVLNLNFRYYYFFNSEPFNAQIFYKDSLLGFTPYRNLLDTKLNGNLVFKKENYFDFIYDFRNYNYKTGAFVKLIPLNPGVTDNVVYKNRGTQFKTKRSLFPVLGLGLASVTGAVFCYNFKNTSNAAYANYLLTGNREKLDESNTYDRYFIATLILMQAAIGGLIYFLFFD